MQPRFRIGLRTIKTALAVVLSLLAASLFGPLTMFPALAAIAVMSRTFDEGLRECRNQAVGITIGGILGCLTAVLWPNPPILLIGAGVVLIIFLCTSLHVVFSCSLSCAIFISACLSDPQLVVFNTLTRLFHTALGLVIGLSINYLVMPYDNSKKVFSLFKQFLDAVPPCLEAAVCEDLYPVLKPVDDLVEQLHYELRLYGRQRLGKRRQQQETLVLMQGCMQLTERMHRELAVLCAMDSVAIPSPPLRKILAEMDLELPQAEILSRQSSPEEQTVTDYHLQKLLDARGFLLELLKQA